MTEHQFQSLGAGIKHGQLAISVKFPKLIDDKLRGLPEKSKTVRRWVIEKMLEEGLITMEEFNVALGLEKEQPKTAPKRKRTAKPRATPRK